MSHRLPDIDLIGQVLILTPKYQKKEESFIHHMKLRLWFARNAAIELLNWLRNVWQKWVLSIFTAVKLWLKKK